MTLTKRAFHPVVAIRSLGEFDRMWREMEKSFKEAWPVASEKLPRLYSGWEPRVDIKEQDEAYLLRADLPGLQLDDIGVEFQDGVLTIRGERRLEEEQEEETDNGYYRKERAYGAFARRFALAATVEADNISATYTNGVLEVRVPKAAEAQAKRIPVQVA